MYTNDIDNRRMFHCFTSYNWQSRLVLDFGCGRAITGFHAVLLWSVHTYFKTGIGSKQRRVTWLWNMFCSLEDGKLIGLVWFKISGSVQDGASTIAKLPYKWLNHGFFVRYNELVHVLYVISPFTLIKNGPKQPCGALGQGSGGLPSLWTSLWSAASCRGAQVVGSTSQVGPGAPKGFQGGPQVPIIPHRKLKCLVFLTFFDQKLGHNIIWPPKFGSSWDWRGYRWMFSRQVFRVAKHGSWTSIR